MKNKFSKISPILLLVTLFTFSSCDDTTDIFTVDEAPIAPVLSELGISSIELDPVNTNTPALTFNWESAEYGQQTAITYSIEFSTDETFTTPVTVSSVTGINAVTFSMSELNSAVGNAGLNPFEWGTIYARVISSLGSQNGVPANSNTISFMAYPYYNYVFDDYFLVGDATAPGWNNNNNNPALFRDANDEKLFTYTGYFGNGMFKVLETKGLWQPQWGTNDGTSIEVNPGGGDDPERFPNAGSSNITPGYYTFTINFSDDSFTFESFNENGIESPLAIVLQGSSISTPISLTALNHDGHIWYANSVRLTPGSFQFSLDGTAWGAETGFSGIATENGTSIPVIVEDDYDVWFNDLTGQYILIPLNL